MKIKKIAGEASSADGCEYEPTDVEHLQGVAMGCMGMSKDDFCRCTPSEFYAAYDAWWQRETDLERGRWKRMRMQCLCSLQPYSKKQLRAQDFMKFPWESEEQKATSCRSQQNGQSREEIMERYREAKKRQG